MGLTIAFLMFTDTLPRPRLWAVTSHVVPRTSDVTLRCQGHLGSDRFQLWKDGELREERNASSQQADFMLRNVDDLRDARTYSCHSGQELLWSELSETLALVVTGKLPRPHISALSGSTLSPGTTCTFRCSMSEEKSNLDYSFALLETKSLEPLQLQNPGRSWVDFSLLSVRPEDTGSYSCIYYRKTVPYVGSYLSKTLELTVSGKLPRPTLWPQPGLLVAPGDNITLWCSRPKLSSHEEVTFTLRNVGTQKLLQQQISAHLWTSFSLPSVQPEDHGRHSCTYREQKEPGRESEASEALQLIVPGSLPKPSLSVLPGLVVKPGMHVTLQCRKPPHISLRGVTFTLLKMGTSQPLKSQSPTGTLAIFPLLSVSAQDAGNYSCVYQERTAPYQVSQPSEVLEIWVIDALSKPSLSAWPGAEVASGSDVTFFCWGPSRGTRFVLYKEEDEKNLLSMNTTQHGALYFLNHVTPNYSGNYSCTYQLSINGSLWTQHSDSLQLIVTGETNKTTGALKGDKDRKYRDNFRSKDALEQ
ncbi:immunoglobulin superfamily member 1-like [Notamacropus eugenii]|uniref:immunoglobulin superfamily member 1-like n=1 Tax=Notamacropus eugenii TaxID=9315 RepID=UPI003B68343F